MSKIILDYKKIIEDINAALRPLSDKFSPEVLQSAFTENVPSSIEVQKEADKLLIPTLKKYLPQIFELS
jgi:hypothetical protein